MFHVGSQSLGRASGTASECRRTIAPTLSVVLPLVDDRGYGESAIASWTGQKASAGCFEIVAVAAGRHGSLVERCRALLRPQDRMETAPGAGEVELYAAGIRAARGEFLLFTEAHCIADPGAVAAVLDHLSGSPGCALQLSGQALAANGFARFETRLLKEGQAAFPGDAWRRVSLRGFVVRRSALSAAGGLLASCGRFAEAVLAIRLARLGIGIEHCPAAQVRHGNCKRARDLAAALRPLGRGQAVWRERCEAGHETEFLPPLSDWSERAAWRRPLARHAVAVLLQILRRALVDVGWRTHARSAVRALPNYLLAALLGSRVPQLRAAARAVLFLAAARCGLPGWRYPAYRRASSELLRWGVLDHAAASPLPAAPTGLLLYPARLPDGVFAGFYGRERWQAEDDEPRVRWSRPFAMLRFAPPAGDYHLHFELHTPLAGESGVTRIFFNGWPLTAGADGSFRIERRWFAPGEQILAFASPPFHPARRGLDDRRELGLAVFAVRVVPDHLSLKADPD